jgi:hypothetical protein
MPTWAWIIIVLAAAILVAGAIAAYIARQNQTRRLRDRFGPEYDRTVSGSGKQRAAEEELAERERKREQLDIVPLTPEARDKYAGSWNDVQTRFVDDPPGAVNDADRLVTDVLQERGYPMDDFDQRAADISVDHPEVIENYRAAHAIYLQGQDNGAGTEDLRQAFVHYRALFEELLETRETASKEARQ